MKQKIRKAIFPVGGLGTRFLPATKSMPKEMLPVVDKPLIQYAFEEALAAGIEQFIFVTGRNKNAITNHFDHAYELQQVLSSSEKKQHLSMVKDWLPQAGQVAFVRQQEPLGLGHAVYCAKNFIGNEPFCVLLADELFMGEKLPMQKMVEQYKKTPANIVVLDEVKKSESVKYGMAEIAEKIDKKTIKLKSMVEKPQPAESPSNYAIVGRYILQPEIFSHLEKTKRGAGGEIQLTDAMKQLAKQQDFYGVIAENKRFDCGSKAGFIQANIAFALEHPEIKSSIKDYIKSL